LGHAQPEGVSDKRVAGRIPESFINDLLARAEIVDIIAAHVELKKAGRDYKARCPFHDERTPSFTVSPSKQFYHCFGCGAHGSAIGFLMAYDGLDYVDAVETLAGRYAMEVPREQGRARRNDQYAAMLDVCEQARRFYRQCLRDSEPAKRYLRERGLDADTCARFGVGYAPDDWHALDQALGKSAEFKQLLETVGLLSRGDKGCYDRFRNRILFPIHDRRGRAIAFGGRLLSGDGPKYLNSPETPLFHKGSELYGYYQARAHLGKGENRYDRLLVVEGYMDVLALVQMDLPNVVATLGTATTEQHAESLFRAAAKLVFCFDGDRAGRDAAWRAAEAVLPRLREGRQAAFLFLPEGEDPDSMVRSEGAHGFRERLDQAMPLSAFFFQQVESGLDIATLDGRAQAAERSRAWLPRVPDGAFRDLLQDECVRRYAVQGLAQHAHARGPGKKSAGAHRTLVRAAITLLLQHPEWVQDIRIPEQLDAAKAPGMEVLLELLDLLQATPGLRTGAVLEHWQGRPEHEPLARLVGEDSPGDAAALCAELQESLDRLAWTASQDRFSQLAELAVQRPFTQEERAEYKKLSAARADIGPE